jgi:hypothetical protein
MIIHNSLPIVISFCGIVVAIYMMGRLKKLPKDKILVIDYFLLGLVNFYVGLIYLLFVVGVVPTVSDLSLFVRPANLLQIIFPAIISWRMGTI